MHILTRIKWTLFKNLFIKIFIRLYHVDMNIAQEPSAVSYPDFNSFFTRALKPSARPIVSGKGEIACPVDGAVSQAGMIDNDRIFQAKGHDYQLRELLANSDKLTRLFINGSFATLYLSPKDYHRIHMPLDGQLQEMIHVPGKLFSVSQRAAAHIPGLFARNERVITLFETEAGAMAVILVGAIFVSSIETVWCGEITGRGLCSGNTTISSWNYRIQQHTEAAIKLERGEEMGRFNMGSTVILLFESDKVDISQDLRPDTPVQMGQLIGIAR